MIVLDPMGSVTLEGRDLRTSQNWMPEKEDVKMM
jgi:hypothetical protein